MKNFTSLSTSTLLLVTIAIFASDLLNVKSANSGTININNEGFEAVSLSNAQFTSPPTLIPDWSYVVIPTRRIGSWNPAAPYYGGIAPEGSNVGYNEGGTISQVLTSQLIANTEYNLQVEVGLVAGTQDYSVQLYAGGVLLAEDVNSLSLVPAISAGGFQTSVVNFNSPATHPELGEFLEIRLNVLQSTDMDFDNVRLSTLDPVLTTSLPDGATIGFGNEINVLTSVDKFAAVNLENSGDTDSILGVLSGAITGPDASLFEFIGGFNAATMVQGASDNVDYNLRFLGSASTGTYTADLEFTFDSGIDPVNYTLTATVFAIPEPSTLTLAALGFLALIRRRRK